MANQFTVTTAQLNQKAGELRANNRNLTTQIENLRGQQRALNGMWEGDARQAFDKAFNQDVQQMQNFYKEIENYVVKLTEIAKTYEQAEAKNLETAHVRTYK
ncbi:MAG: WXG100 family type VII secretion target [Eubacterium sp.]|jgi:WXG100 family type VII secretion target|nr:WXG100 family type VII secretion target [Eubacterium sp.]